MYIRYFTAGPLNYADVRDVRHFHIEQLDSGAAIVDAMAERSTYFGNEAVKSLSSYLLGSKDKVEPTCRIRDDVISIGLEGASFSEELAIFESAEAAARVLDEICKALASGMQYFDLTLYGDDGNLL